MFAVHLMRKTTSVHLLNFITQIYMAHFKNIRKRGKPSNLNEVTTYLRRDILLWLFGGLHKTKIFWRNTTWTLATAQMVFQAFSKQEMELFLPLPGLWSKNFFYIMFLICSKGFKINFQNRKWNYPNRRWNYFSHFQASDQITSFRKCFLFVPRGSKLIYETGNGII